MACLRASITQIARSLPEKWWLRLTQHRRTPVGGFGLGGLFQLAPKGIGNNANLGMVQFAKSQGNTLLRHSKGSTP
jgi:hypothetical protein